MLKKIKNTIEKFSLPDCVGQAGLFKKSDVVLVAVSGGPDSVCLLLALEALRKEFGIKLYAAHLNHKLRGAESDKDEHYVKNLTEKLKIPFITESQDVKKFAKDKKLSLEQAARELRYNFLLKVAKNIAANKIATGHTKDDQADTLLMLLFRGSGLRGLRAIPAARKASDNIWIVRPLIETSRKDIVAFLKKKKIKPRLDSSNLENIFLRNRIRNNLLPFIEKHFTPNIKDILSRTVNNLKEDYDYLIKQQEKTFRKIAKIKKNNSVSISTKKFIPLPISLKRGVVRIAIENIKGDLNKIDYRHWDEIENLISKRRLNSEVHLPGKVNVIKNTKTIDFIKMGTGTIKMTPKMVPVPIKIPIKISLSKNPPRKFHKSRNIEYFDADKIKFPLKVRFKKPGDKIKPLGMKKYKRLQDVFVDDKIKAHKRDRIPLVVDVKGRIIWICGIRMSEDFKITPTTERYLKLEYL